MLRVVIIYLISFCFSAVLYAQEEPITVYFEREDNTKINFYADNTSIVPHQLEINLKNSVNLKASVQLPHFLVVEANATRQYLFHTTVQEKGKSTALNFDYKYQQGDPTKVVDANFEYYFPYAHSKKYKVVQGYLGKLTHENSYSLDFDLDIGDTVHASRAGIVTEVKSHFEKGGPDIALEGLVNKVVVMHDDGTFAHYVHLDKNGSLVKVGEQVAAGQAIAISGNTGFSYGPHLHFMVVKSEKMGHRTIPTLFKQQGKAVSPQDGGYYYSVHEGGPAFEIISADQLDFEKLRSERYDTELKNELKVSTEKIDDVVLVYIENGYNKRVQGKLSADLTNMTSTNKLPFDFSVPANTKIFIFSLAPKDHAKAHAYKFSVSFQK